ncbi:MAG: hypothetical protein KDB99_13595 [Chitinophagaceae bacterium]|nr:hypothetical protein [Chitinophagaceae bacterium]
MKKIIAAISILFLLVLTFSFSSESLRSIYSKPPEQWPKPFVDDGVEWTELGILPLSPIEEHKDSLYQIIELGKTLFFDTRLSSSGKISCATCHQPALNWTDGKEKSIGHNGAINKRNSPTIANSWFYKKLFWDGRAKDLQDQAFAPINSESEMNSEMHDLVMKLRKIDGYRQLFKKAFGSEMINPEMLTKAIATFEKTIVSQKSRFDDFLEGDKEALTNSEIRGLHLFRTKARCMNCHHGALFTDNQFHNIGFSGNDAGYFFVSHQDVDSGKFKTPSLRDVMKTGPWMHDGKQTNMEELINLFSDASMEGNKSDMIKPIRLTTKEKKDLVAFLHAISASATRVQEPIFPE